MIENLKVGWIEYEVIEKEYDDSLINKGKQCYGKISYENRIIYINKGFHEREKASTLLHETIHAIDNFMSLDMDERVVTTIADGLSMVISDNPDFLKQLKQLHKQ